MIAIALAPAGNAQTGRLSYGPSHLWWDAGIGDGLPRTEDYDNPRGQLRIFNKSGAVDTKNHPFFESLGVNGRACVTCHQPSNAMSVTPAMLGQRWRDTQGKDPVFASVDGSNCPNLPQAEASSHSLLLSRGLFRIFLPWPPKGADGHPIKPEFRIEVVRDPTGCNTSPVYGLASREPVISVYRRPRVAANLSYLVPGPAGVNFMADGREPTLQSQATTAALVHEQAKTAPSAEQLRRILDFETQVYAAQNWDIRGGRLGEKNGPPLLGPESMADGKAGPLAASANISFISWKELRGAGLAALQIEFRESAARGSDLFFSRTFRIDGNPATVTCAGCHQPGVPRWMDVGTTNHSAAKESSELPQFKIVCDSSAPPHPVLGRVFYSEDPGRALISGKCADAGSIAIQQFRGLSARAPYFSNGSAADLREVVEFYDRRFKIGYTEPEKQDLVNFLSIL